MARVSFLTFVLLSTLISLPSPLSAQYNPDQVVQLIERVGAVEEENRELRGQIEEARHEVNDLKQRLETISADLDYRLNHPERGASPPQEMSSSPTEPKAQVSSQASQGAPIPLGRSPSEPSGPPRPQATSASDPTDAYEKARSLLEQGEYEAAERAFAAFIAAHPKDKNAGAAQYWLGVTYFVRGQYEKASATFAQGYKLYPKSPKAPDNLLKMAKSLAALNRTADACTTLTQLSKEHPKAHVNEVTREKKNLGCK